MVNVMIAEDNTAIANCYQTYLTNEKNINIIGIANDGKKALELYKEKKPDLILLDLGLPIIDGLSFIEKVTDMSFDNLSNIIVISGDLNLRLNLCNMKKVYMSVSKPINMDYLIELINRFDSESSKKSFPIEKTNELFLNLNLKPYGDSSVNLQKILETAYKYPYLRDNLTELYNVTAKRLCCTINKLQSSVKSSVRIINKCDDKELMRSIFHIKKYNPYQQISPKTTIQYLVEYLES